MNDNDIKKAYIFGNILLGITKWLFLLLMVISIGITLGLIVFEIIYGNKMSFDLLNIISKLFIFTTSDELTELLSTYGKTKVLIALTSYGVALSLTRLMYYLLITRFITLYRNITIGDLFTRKSNKLVDEMMGISFLATFTTPIIVFIINLTTGIDIEKFIHIGYMCLFIFIGLFILRIILNRGIDITRENNKYDRIINDYKADIDELKIQSIKRDSELKKLKNIVKEQEAKNNKKEVTKKKTKKKTTSK